MRQIIKIQMISICLEKVRIGSGRYNPYKAQLKLPLLLVNENYLEWDKDNYKRMDKVWIDW